MPRDFSKSQSRNMKRQQVWRIGLALFILLVMQSANSAEINASKNPAKIIEKFKCNTTEFDWISDNANVEESTNNSSINLKCSEDHVLFRNISEEDFIKGVYNGALQYQPLQRTFDPNEFCIVDVDNVGHHTHQQTTFTLLLCNETKSLLEIEVRKCCKPDERLDKREDEKGKIEYACVQIPNSFEQKTWNPAVFRSTSDDYKNHKDLINYTNVEYTESFPNCSGMSRSLNNSKDMWFMLLEDGSVEIGLKFWFKPVWLPVEDDNFCLDEFLDHDPSLEGKEVDSHEIYHKNQILLFCNIAHFDDYLFHRKLFGGMCVTAAGIVFVLLIIYVSIWDKQNLAGWTQFNIFVALFFVVLMEGLRTLFDSNALKVQSTPGCVIIAAVAQYFFFALNTTWTVMCFDLFYMFWKLETTSKTAARYIKRLSGYLIFSWGLPLIVVCLAFYMNHSTALEDMNKMEGVYAFAHRRCSSPIRKLGFQTQGIMFLLNLLFFLLTTVLIWRHRRGINSAKKKSRSERHTWRSVTLFMKLVIVMGVTSLSIPVDYFFGSSNPLSTIAVCLRLVHFIPFFAVLFIFGFNEKNVILISQKYPRLGRYFGFVACTSSATASETINHSRSGNCNRISELPSSQT